MFLKVERKFRPNTTATGKTIQTKQKDNMNETDKKVRALYDVVQQKKNEIQSAERPNWVTNCNFNYDPKATGVNTQSNIQTVTDANELVRALGFLKVQKGAFEEAAKELGKAKAKFTWGGYEYDDWKADFLTRINKIELATKKKELAALEARLDSILSPELKAQFEIEAITKELGM